MEEGAASNFYVGFTVAEKVPSKTSGLKPAIKE